MFEVIPAIDLIDGKCVRLTQGDFSQKTVYAENPFEVAQKFADAGLTRLHLVDLDGAKSGAVQNIAVLEKIASQTDLQIDFGGGIKTDGEIRAVFDAGAEMVSLGSIGVRNPEKFFEWLDEFGSERILLGADVRGEKLAVNGWQTQTELELVPFLQNYFSRGVRKVFCTDISKDGFLQGSANSLYAKVLADLPELFLLASGGVSSLSDLAELHRIGCRGAIVGKAIYEGKISLAELAEFQNESVDSK